MCLHWHNEEEEGKDFTKFLSQVSSPCVLELGGEKKWKTFKTSSEQMATTKKKSNFSDSILSKDCFLLVFLVGIIIF